MGNLSEIKRDILINKLDADFCGVYTDSEKQEKVFFFKKNGYSMFAHGIAEKDFGFIKSEASPGVAKVMLYSLNNLAPVTPAAYDETVSVDPRIKDPGVDKPLRLNAKTYGGTFNVDVAAGLISDDSLATIINAMVQQSYDDVDNDGIFHFGYAAEVVHEAGGTLTINGTDYVNANITSLVTEINAGDDAFAYEIDATHYAVILKGEFASIALNGGGTLGSPQLGIMSLDVNVQFDTRFMQTLKGYTTISAPIFPFLTTDDIDKIVRNVGNHGELNILAPSTRPIAGEDYVKFFIYSSSDAYNNQTPGGDLKHRNGVNLYILKSELGQALWDGTNPMMRATTYDFEALLGYWMA